MKYFIILIIMTSTIACSKSPAEIALENETEILEYIESNNIENTIKTNSGLYYVVEKTGNNTFPTATSDVEVKYSGYFTDDLGFDSGQITTNLQAVIRGWTEGIQLFSEGGEGKLFVPSFLGYGEEGRGNIPGNTVLIFDIELIDVK